MTEKTFRALVARDVGGGHTITLEQLNDADLPEGDVTVDIEYSSFNYKDGLALKGMSGILRRRPIVPGIDLAGTVANSSNADFRPGDKVVLTGWGVGESWSGGFSERARLRGEWLNKLQQPLTPRAAMAIGTAGLTAMLCVMALERHRLAVGSEVLVTGAAGGVGSVAVLLLSRAGYRVTALTGRPEQADFLRSLGAIEIFDRSEFQQAGKPLQTERWQGAVDTVGGGILANVIASIAYGGAVAACGLAGGADLVTTVLPFILRGVSLLGVDSVRCPMPVRTEVWQRLASTLSENDLSAFTQEVGLADLPGLADSILRGRVRGRILVNVRL